MNATTIFFIIFFLNTENHTSHATSVPKGKKTVMRSNKDEEMEHHLSTFFEQNYERHADEF